MEIGYQRELSSNYMILRGPEIQTASEFECQMLSENDIEGLLRFRMRRTGSSAEFCYEITSRQPLSRILQNRKLRGEDIRTIVRGLLRTAANVREYLLEEESILLSPEYVYADPDTLEVRFCMVPGYRQAFCEELSMFLKVLLEKTDHQDPDGIMTAYHLYEESRRENYGMADLLRCLDEQEARMGMDNRAGTREDETDVFQPEEELPTQEYALPEEVREPRLFKGVFSGMFPGSRETAEGPPKRGKQRRKLPAALACMAAVEFLIWYLLGTRGLVRFGAAAPAVFCVYAVLQAVTARRKKPGEKEINKPLSAGRAPLPEREESAAEEWRIRPETVREAGRRREESRIRHMEKSYAEGTVMLSRSAAAGILLLEPERRSMETICVTYTPFVLGKHPELSDACVNGDAVSRMHVRIDAGGDRCSVTDLNSTNGTRVNGRTLEANETARLEEGDLLELADVIFRVRYPKGGLPNEK